MYDFWLESNLDKATSRYQHYLHEAEQEHLAKLARSQQNTLVRRLALWFSRALIYAGLHLKRRYRVRREQLYVPMLPNESGAVF